jgi:hypothetical protein
MTLIELSKTFALDCAGFDKAKSRTAEGTLGFVNICSEQHAVIMNMIAELKPICERLA